MTWLASKGLSMTPQLLATPRHQYSGARQPRLPLDISGLLMEATVSNSEPWAFVFCRNRRRVKPRMHQ